MCFAIYVSENKLFMKFNVQCFHASLTARNKGMRNVIVPKESEREREDDNLSVMTVSGHIENNFRIIHGYNKRSKKIYGSDNYFTTGTTTVVRVRRVVKDEMFRLCWRQNGGFLFCLLFLCRSREGNLTQLTLKRIYNLKNST